MYFVYILQSEKNGQYYIGSTSNVEARLDYHNSGRQRSTKHRIPFRLVYSETLETKTAALKREQEESLHGSTPKHTSLKPEWLSTIQRNPCLIK